MNILKETTINITDTKSIILMEHEKTDYINYTYEIEGKKLRIQWEAKLKHKGEKHRYFIDTLFNQKITIKEM